MRYTVGIYLDNGNPVELGGATLDKAIALAKSLTHPSDEHPWWEVVDEMSGCVVASSDNYHNKKGSKGHD